MKKILTLFLAISIVLTSLFFFYLYPRFIIVSGYAAKNLCSCVFVAGIPEEKAISEDLNFNIISYASTNVDYDNKSVTASVHGLKPRTAYYNEITGCTLVSENNQAKITTYSKDWVINKYDSLENWFEYIDTVEYLTSEQLSQLNDVVKSAFQENDPENPKKNTRAALVLYKGQLVAEHYASGFNKNSRLMGWSMTKSLTSSVFDLLQQEGRIGLNGKTKIPEWQEDERKNITWKQLLQMNSGLRWKEDYASVTDAVTMLFNSDAAGGFAMQLPIEYPPNHHWEYSSATTNIIATYMHSLFNSTDEYIQYPYNNLFYKIGMYSMLMETDASGRFVGSSYAWATTRDWAKMGQLYLQGGKWAGEQIISPSWVDFVRSPAPNSNQIYGGHFWLNIGGRFPDLPADLYNMDGFQGQKVFIIPSKDLVIVRLGLTYNRDDFNFNSWVKEIINAVESAPEL